MLAGVMFEIPSLSGHEEKVMIFYFWPFRGRWRPLLASEVSQLYRAQEGMARGFRNGKAL